MVEKDNYKDGCDPESAQIFHDNTTVFKAEKQDDLINKLLEFTDADKDAIDINSCGEIGRIDVQKMETANDSTPRKDEINLWKRNKLDLYAITYTFYVENVTPAHLTE